MPEEGGPRRWWIWLLAGLGLALGLAALVAWGEPLFVFLSSRDRIRAWVEELGPWGPAAIVLLEIVQVLAGPLPGTAVEAVSGFLFGPWWGTLYAMAGIVSGALVAFFLARRFGRPLVARLAGPRALDHLDRLVERGGDLFFFLLWLLPLVPDDLVCLAAALTNMSTRRFLLLMAVGRLPGILFATWLGANLSHVDPAWWLAVPVVVGVLALVWWRWGERVQRAWLSVAERLFDRRAD